jgi:hypothetical protein
MCSFGEEYFMDCPSDALNTPEIFAFQEYQVPTVLASIVLQLSEKPFRAEEENPGRPAITEVSHEFSLAV